MIGLCLSEPDALDECLRAGSMGLITGRCRVFICEGLVCSRIVFLRLVQMSIAERVPLI